ncbi:MAG: AarF/ABC1/UbiB kinase family protein [bacterium]|nr:AarF/ABC1/UbiB kinase family protein [bacterium]
MITLLILWRSVRILWLGSGFVVARLLDRLRPAGRPAKLSGPQRLLRLFERLGGIYIKLGQLLALQPDILPLEYCNELMKLLDRVPPFAFEDVERLFLEELGSTPAELFDPFEREPLAAASIAQVHVAYLDGRKLAVKVQRPTVGQDFAPDIRLMWAVVRTAEWLRLRQLAWVARPLREFVTWTREELDFRREARYMKALAHQTGYRRTAVVPAVIDRFTSRRILVAEFLEGPTVLEHIRSLDTPDPELERRLSDQGFDAEQLARNIIDNFVGTAFRDGLFHADLHPANLLILPDSVVGYVDFGITGSLSPYARRRLAIMTLMVTRGEPEQLLESFLKVATTDRHSDVDGMLDDLRERMEVWFEGKGEHRRMRTNFTFFMLDMLRISRRTSIWPNPDVVRYIRSVVATDGLITRFAPRFEIAGYLQTSCENFFAEEERRQLRLAERLSDLAASGARLLVTGSEQLTAFLERRSFTPAGTAGRPKAKPKRRRYGSRLGRRDRAIQLMLILLSLVLLVVQAGPEARWGLNLFTVGTLALPVAAGALLWHLRRLV